MRQHEVITDFGHRVQKFGLNVSSTTSWFSFNLTKSQAQSGKWEKQLIHRVNFRMEGKNICKQALCIGYGYKWYRIIIITIVIIFDPDQTLLVVFKSADNISLFPVPVTKINEVV